MKKAFLALLVVVLITISCKKNDGGCAYRESGAVAPAAEKSYLRSYLASNAISATEDSSGVFYTISNPGTGSSPTICSTMTVKYIGTLIPSGTHFGSDTSAAGFTYPLGELVEGWKKVLPNLKEGGSMILYVPPSLGYGQQNKRDLNGNIVIPGNSYLRFAIQLLDVQ